jgi:hypothetical protein
MLMKILPLLATVAGVTPGAALATCMPPTVTGSEAYVYMSTVVTSMGYAKDALDRFQNNGASPTASDILYELKAASAAFGCAQQLLATFTQSKDERISKTAEVLALEYEGLKETDRIAGEQLVSLLDSQRPVPSGTLSDLFATLRQQQDEAWRGLMQALTLTSQVLPVFNQDGSPARRVRLTNTERQGLRRELESIFGKSIRKGMVRGQNYLTTAAAGLHSFLGNQKFRSSDDV